MLTLKELHLQAVGRFVEPQILNFEALGNLVQVDGENHNTQGSSGSGKSTVFNSIDYLLGLNDIPSSVLQSRLTKEGMLVRGIFDLNGLPLEISRGKKGLKITLNGETVEGSSKLAEEKLDQILGMPRELFRKLLHKRQKEGGFFLNLTPKEMNGFLVDTLGLSHLSKKLLLAEAKIKQTTEEGSRLANEFSSCNSAYEATKNAFASIGEEPKLPISPEQIEELKNKKQQALNVYTETIERHQKENKELQKERPSVEVKFADTSVLAFMQEQKKTAEDSLRKVVDDNNKRIASIQLEISSLKNEHRVHLRSIEDGQVAKSEALKTSQEIKKIKEAICPTCEQNWLTDTAKSKESELMSKLLGFKANIVAGELAVIAKSEVEQKILKLQQDQAIPINNIKDPIIANISKMEANIADEKKKIDDINFGQNALNKIKMDAFTDKQAILNNNHSIEVSGIAGQLEVQTRLLDSAISQLRAYKDASERHNTTVKHLKAQEATIVENLKDLAAKFEVKKEENEIAEEIRQGIKTFISYSFDDALETISDNATRIIRNIPNMANATIQLQGSKETKDGKVKEEVNAVLSIDGELEVPIKSLSGGERSSVDLAIDLAVVDLIEERTGLGVNLFILDEPFTGLDSVSIEMALEILKSSNSNKKLIIVDHNETVKEMVGNRVIVIREGQTSRIEQ